MSDGTPQKETPACGGRRAGDAISGGVRSLVSMVETFKVKKFFFSIQEPA